MRRRLALVVVAACLATGWLVWRNGWLGGRARSSPPSVLLVSIDTLRADHIGTYGYQAAATPVIDALAARGLRFEQAATVTPLTLPAHASLLSTDPSNGGVYDTPPKAVTLRFKGDDWYSHFAGHLQRSSEQPAEKAVRREYRDDAAYP